MFSQAAREEAVSRPAFDVHYVKRVAQYFAEDRKGELLQDGWNRAAPSASEAKQGIDWLCEIGFNDVQKEDVIATTIVELLVRRCVSWETIKESLAGYMKDLEELQMDVPTAGIFFHSLLSRLLLQFGKDFSPAILKTLPMQANGDGAEFTWSLLIGAFRKLRDRGGLEAFQRSLTVPDVTSVAARARRCTASELKRHLHEEVGL